MRNHGGTPSRRDECVMLAAISPPGASRGRFVGAHQPGPAGVKRHPLIKRGASSCSSQHNASGNDRAPLHDRVRLAYPTLSFWANREAASS